ncbi:hypothetical protein J2S10_005487 [Neobacillus ginsengisoli]|uniref:Uncharacterized protein n=1 Tax=Neobacillus ginsengisoli TaxID=904295 RepID=A0ABT9Y348_9BACI|nr:hypothetical protein [Neobacillus ginsengisoli]
MLRIISEYLWRNKARARQRAIFIPDERVGFHNE